MFEVMRQPLESGWVCKALDSTGVSGLSGIVTAFEKAIKLEENYFDIGKHRGYNPMTKVREFADDHTLRIWFMTWIKIEEEAGIGGDVEWTDCWECGGDGVNGHECGDDTCCCLDPEDNMLCHTCEDKGNWATYPGCDQ